jgi:hypothetical protein
MTKTNSADLNDFFKLSFSLLLCGTRSDVSDRVRKRSRKLPRGGKWRLLRYI